MDIDYPVIWKCAQIGTGMINYSEVPCPGANCRMVALTFPAKTKFRLQSTNDSFNVEIDEGKGTLVHDLAFKRFPSIRHFLVRPLERFIIINPELQCILFIRFTGQCPAITPPTE